MFPLKHAILISKGENGYDSGYNKDKPTTIMKAKTKNR